MRGRFGKDRERRFIISLIYLKTEKDGDVKMLGVREKQKRREGKRKR